MPKSEDNTVIVLLGITEGAYQRARVEKDRTEEQYWKEKRKWISKILAYTTR
jgi:hypothetical protein